LVGKAMLRIATASVDRIVHVHGDELLPVTLFVTPTRCWLELDSH